MDPLPAKTLYGFSLQSDFAYKILFEKAEESMFLRNLD